MSSSEDGDPTADSGCVSARLGSPGVCPLDNPGQKLDTPAWAASLIQRLAKLAATTATRRITAGPTTIRLQRSRLGAQLAAVATPAANDGDDGDVSRKEGGDLPVLGPQRRVFGQRLYQGFGRNHQTARVMRIHLRLIQTRKRPSSNEDSAWQWHSRNHMTKL